VGQRLEKPRIGEGGREPNRRRRSELPDYMRETLLSVAQKNWRTFENELKQNLKFKSLTRYQFEMADSRMKSDFTISLVCH
jgi:hypothetical protein